jgi:glycosyltransferase involved in cell wall biosynthesis
MSDRREIASKANHIAILLQSLDGGGAQRRSITLANAFARLGRQVDLVLVGDRGKLIDEISPQVRLSIPERREAQPTRREAVGSLANWLAREDPDVLVSGAAALHSLAVAARKKVPHIPLVLRASSHPFRPIPWSMPKRRLKELFERRRRARCYALADSILAVSEDVAGAVRRLASVGTVRVIRNPVVTSRFLAGLAQPIALPWDQNADIPMILSVGRVHPAKDFPTLLRAFAILRSTRRARLVIIGESAAPGDDRVIHELIGRLGIGADVALIGSTDAVAAWLLQSALFVSSSVWEGSPAVLIEAMAVGCAVVATDCPGGSRELLEDGRLGHLVPIRDPAAMARAMAAELDHPTRPALLRAASEPYREDGRAEEYLAAIDDCVQGRSRRGRRNGKS